MPPADSKGWSTRQIARELGIDQSNVVRALALLDLPASVMASVEAGTLAPATAYEIGKLDDPEAQSEVAQRVASSKLSRAEVVEEVRRASARTGKTPKGRGASAKAKKTSTSFRTSSGFKITVEHRRGVDEPAILGALSELLAQLNNRTTPDSSAAA